MRLPDVISQEDLVYEVQRKVILELAEKEPCVIIGRNADYILKDRDDVLNVFIHGDMPEKIQRISHLHIVDEKEAVKMMADTDKRRMTNYNFYTEWRLRNSIIHLRLVNICFVRIKNKLLNRYYLYYNEAIVRLTVR